MVESTIETTVVNRAKMAGWLVRKLKWIERRGAPDRLFAKRGRFILIEFKDVGLPLEPLQKRERERLEAAGFEVHRADSVARALWILGIE